MKTKYFFLLAIATILTLSFTFISGSKSAQVIENQVIEDSSSPVGGLVADDKF